MARRRMWGNCLEGHDVFRLNREPVPVVVKRGHGLLEYLRDLLAAWRDLGIPSDEVVFLELRKHRLIRPSVVRQRHVAAP